MSTKDRPWIPRLSLDLTEERYYELQRLIPWGMKTAIFNTFIDELLAIANQEHGQIKVALLQRRGFTIQLKESKYAAIIPKNLPSGNERGGAPILPDGNQEQSSESEGTDY